MKSCRFGEPIFFEGEYQEDKLYDLYVISFSCIFEIKENKIPSIQIKNNLGFIPTDYVKSSNGDIVTLCLTNIDFELFKKQYNISYIKFHSGWKFKSVKGLFTQYIKYWTERKIQSKKDENGSIYLISKLMLNSLYGKFGLNPNVRGKYPTLDENEIIRYKFYKQEIRESIYIPVATFITSYARRKTIETSQKIRDYSMKKYKKDLYVYSDTDSIHCLFEDGKELQDIIEIDDYQLGYWKEESHFVRRKIFTTKMLY